MKQTDPQYKLRLPQELKDLIEEAAKANGRSMNAEMVFRLEQTFGAESKIPDVPIEQPADTGYQLITLSDASLDRLAERLAERPSWLKTMEKVFQDRTKDADGNPIMGDNGTPSRTPTIPGQNAPKRGLGAAPKAEKPKKEKPGITKKKVYEAEPTKIKLDHTSKEKDE
ncbi:hypothetical protein C4E15_06795 [Achromobacter spanius]|uniref:Arc-like DNA binding domain-containing protein n=1 Tax=Achromobacter spanius TaxID=217203 RepID=A0A2S5GU69_9BURK|nr:Arc family DNA-binding protein [Achromobacter spanius]PPA76496.1 hypothetical protein C4E15_06795 [Achromobacter spanius]